MKAARATEWEDSGLVPKNCGYPAPLPRALRKVNAAAPQAGETAPQTSNDYTYAFFPPLSHCRPPAGHPHCATAPMA